MDSGLTSGSKSGYLFVYTPTTIDATGHYQQYTLNANPSQSGISGNTYYFTDHTHVIRGLLGGPASVTDSSVAQ